MGLNQEEFDIWLSHLYAETFRKGTGALEESKDKFCCLGVACKVLIPEEKLIKMTVPNNTILNGGTPNSQTAAPDWLKAINDDFKIKTTKRLITLNDVDGFTHPEIAMLLDLVYNHKMLD